MTSSYDNNCFATELVFPYLVAISKLIRLSYIVIAVAILMITGTIFYPIIGKQQQAYSESGGGHQLRGQEQAVRSSLEQRNQNQQQRH